MNFPADYLERVYAGVLGKIIGVYLGRPIEGWSYDRIVKEIGLVESYVHEKLKQPLIVTDDDISGTFTFIRALEDYDFDPNLTPRQIGQTWMNYLIENRTILWWGGLGTSTEHTAYLRMKHGINPPRSGSIELNGHLVAEQIGSQIFIDGWGMIAPNDPDLAASLATRASQVSHDGEAIYGAIVVATIEAMAFGESDIPTLVARSLGFIPKDCTIATMNRYLLELRKREPDWQKARDEFAKIYNYENYAGGCHMVPNHGVIILALLWGDGDFSRSLMIANTCGWDTDCNSGNVGAIMGVRNGVSSIGANWREPVADRIYIPTADGGRCVSDAASEAVYLANVARRFRKMEPAAPKNGARFHFDLPGSVQGFSCKSSDVRIENVGRTLYVALPGGASARQILTRTHPPISMFSGAGYAALASPTLYAGQTMRASVRSESAARARLVVRVDAADAPQTFGGEWTNLAPGAPAELRWSVQTPPGAVIVEAGIELESTGASNVSLDWLTWDGEPNCVFRKPQTGGAAWKHAWVSSLFSVWHEIGDTSFMLVQNEGRGIMTTGTRQWQNYRVQATIMPHMVRAMGLAARYQGQSRYYALLLLPGIARLIKRHDEEQVLAECPFVWRWRQTYELALRIQDERIEAYVDDKKIFEIFDAYQPLVGGAIGVLCDEGQIHVKEVTVTPA